MKAQVAFPSSLISYWTYPFRRKRR